MKLEKYGPFVLLMVVLAALSLLAGCDTGKSSSAADYPKSTIKMISPTSAGGGYDLQTRLIARFLPRYLSKKVDVIVENQPGAGQMLGVHSAYAAAPDGYTIGAFNAISAFMGQFVRPEEVKIDMAKFRYLGMWQQDVRSIGFSNKVNFKTWGELVAASREKPILCGTGGVGDAQHIDPLMVTAVSDLKLKFVHYDGSAQVEPAMGRGEIEMNVAAVATILRQEENKVGRLFTVFAEKRHPLAPNVPTAAEAGMPKEQFAKLMEVPFFGGDRVLAVPPGTDPAIVEILRTAVWKVFQDPEYLAEVEKMKGENNPMPGKEYEELVVKKIKAVEQHKELVEMLKELMR